MKNLHFLPERAGACALRIWRAACVCAVSALGLASAARAAQDEAKPNVLLILVDDMGWQDTSVPFHFDANGQPVSSPGNGIFKTPGMEKLAERGMRFTQAYTPSVCSPSRTAIMTGLNPSRTHITNWTDPGQPRDTSMHGIKAMNPPAWRIQGMTSKDPSLAKMFKGAGYRTIFVGKAHFGPTPNKEAQPKALGFDVNIGGCGAGQPGSYYGKDNYAEKAFREQKKMGPRDVPDLDKYHGSDTFLTDALNTEMTREIKKSVDMKKPFFAYFGHYAVHGPLMMDPQFEAAYPGLNGALKKYATLISGMDKSLLSLLDTLEKEGVAENTLIVFASDNGGTAPKQQPCKPLRGMKGTPYEGGIRTPLIIAWAKPNPDNPLQKKYSIKPGSACDRVVALQDMFATLGSMVKGKVPAKLDSQDISGLLTEGGKCNRPQTYFLNFPHEHEDAYYTLLRDGDWKVIYRYHKKAWELYNLKDDIGEQKNLADTEPKKLAEMARKLVAEHKRHDAQFPIDAQTKKPAQFVMPGAASSATQG